VYLSHFENLISIAHHVTDDVIITDAELKVQHVNPSFLKHTGYEPIEYLGKSPDFLYGPLTNLEDIIEVSNKLAQHLACAAELTNYKKNGEVYRNRIRFVPIFNTENKLIHYYAVQQDITQSYNNQLIANQVFDESIHPSCYTDTEGKVLNANKCFCKLVELTTHEIIGQKPEDIFKLIHKNSNSFTFHRTKNSDDGMEHSLYEYTSKSNKKILLKATLKKIELLGQIYCYYFFENVTELKNQHDLIEQQKKLIQGYFASSAEGIYILNQQGVVLGFNKYAENATQELYGKSVQLGQYFGDLIKAPKIATLFRQNLVKAFNGILINHEAYYDISENGNGNPEWFKIKYQPILNESDIIEAVSLTIRSIEKEKQAQVLINKQTEQLEKIAKINAHDVRGPLATLLGLVNLITIDNQNIHVMNDYVSKIKEAAGQLDKVIRAIVREAEE
jgi:PAS domain S-box-containing protein